MSKVVLAVEPLGFPWKTSDPFLFCVHHLDAYPAGNEKMGPAVSLAGRKLGMDFEVKDGFRMYHGHVVPGFPQHPHRGFETVTIARRGFIDHSDSLGAAARFGQGDVQWMTAGRGIVHSEMFPLLDQNQPNPVELFQIWLNLPAANKLDPPEFKMLWSHSVPRRSLLDEHGRTSELTVIAGALGDLIPPQPPKSSWAARPENDVAIWTLRMDPGAEWTLPKAAPGTSRTLYFFRGASLQVGDTEFDRPGAIQVRAETDILLKNGPELSEILLLQGKPIAETVAHYGPFVMNTREQLEQAIADYRRTQFGGWPWPSDDPVHPRSEGRFARHTDGRIERWDR